MPWFSKTKGNTYATLLHHPFLFGENQRSAQEVARRIPGAVAGEVYAKVNIPSTHHIPLSPALHYLPSASRFPLPHFTLAVLFALSFPISSSLSRLPFPVAFLFACVLDYLLPGRNIIPNCVTSRIPIIMISLVLRLLLLIMMSLVKSILLC